MTTNPYTSHERRVRALLMRASAPKLGSARQKVMKLLGEFPLAREIRFESKCPDCNRPGYMSFVHPRFQRDYFEDDIWWQDVGYFCPSCRFDGAGSRAKYLTDWKGRR